MYQRIIPRDLFNESKVLKNMGQLAVIIHDGRDKSGYFVPEGLRLDFDEEYSNHFVIDQNPLTGDLVTPNLRLYFKGRRIEINSTYNRKEPYTLLFENELEGGEEQEVFNDDGTFSEDFKNFLANV